MLTKLVPNLLRIPRFYHGNLKDQDRIFTNVYRDGDPFI